MHICMHIYIYNMNTRYTSVYDIILGRTHELLCAPELGVWIQESRLDVAGKPSMFPRRPCVKANVPKGPLLRRSVFSQAPVSAPRLNTRASAFLCSLRVIV